MPDATADERFFRVLSSILDVPRDALGPESSRDSVEEWDSLKHMYVMLALEDAFNVEFTDDEIANLSSASALMDAIAAKTRAALPPQ
jgi:acyl carrier protein